MFFCEKEDKFIIDFTNNFDVFKCFQDEELVDNV